jgi:predicted nucleotidyltransferase
VTSLKDVERALRRHKPALRERFKVKSIGVFGSYARAEEGADSDVDILVELTEPIGWEIVDLKDFLEGVLGLRIDIVTTKVLRRELSETIMKEVVFA